MVSQVKYSIYSEFEEVIDVYKKSVNYGYALFVEIMPILDQIKPRAQGEDIIYHDNSENNKIKENQ